MNPAVRKAFPLFALLVGIAALAYAMSFRKLPEADFSFQAGDQLQTLDPHKAKGQPEHRVLVGLFEGLMNEFPAADQPDADGLMPMAAAPGVATHFDLSDDGKVYTFHLRDNARWSDDTPVTAHDFTWSWKRALHPETASEYAVQLHYLEGAVEFNTEVVEVGDQVEVELADRPNEDQLFPSGTILRGTLLDIKKPSEPERAATLSDKEWKKVLAGWKQEWVFVVDVKGEGEGEIEWDSTGKPRAFSAKSKLEQVDHEATQLPVERSMHVLTDFATTVGVEALDDHTLVVRLKNATAYFPSLTSFYTLFPVNRKCVETHGTPEWTKAENFVGNGAYTLEMRRIRDRIRMLKSDTYWNADEVAINRIDALAVKNNTTALNMYLNDQMDWATDVPKSIIPEIMEHEKLKHEWVSGPVLIVYFYRLNVDRKPLDDPRVRRALNMAINKQEIVTGVSRAGEIPARSVVPPGLAGYTPAYCDEYNLEKAKQLLAEAGYPGGRGMDPIEVLYNTNDNHKMIAEVIERNWNQLGVKTELRNLEWGSYLSSMHKVDFDACRAGWVADYGDPNTFLDMWVTGGGNNETNWGNSEYDELIEKAKAEPNPEKRMELLHSAERILMDELPIIPIYYYVSINMVKPHVKGFHANVLDKHPLQLLKLESP